MKDPVFRREFPHWNVTKHFGRFFVQVNICLTNGRHHVLCLDDQAQAQNFLHAIRPWEIFSRPALRLFDSTQTLIFNTAQVESIRFETDYDPGWAPALNVLKLNVRDQADYQRDLDRLGKKYGVNEGLFEPGTPQELAVAVHMVSGDLIYLNYYFFARPAQEQLAAMTLLFNQPPIPIPCTSGYLLLNPAKISHVSVYPGLQEEAERA